MVFQAFLVLGLVVADGREEGAADVDDPSQEIFWRGLEGRQLPGLAAPPVTSEHARPSVTWSKMAPNETWPKTPR